MFIGRVEHRFVGYHMKALIFMAAFLLTCAIMLFTDLFSWTDLTLFYLAYPSPTRQVENQDIIMITIDGKNSSSVRGDVDFENIGLSVELRARYARLLKNIIDDGCKVVWFDMEFSRTSVFDDAFIQGLSYAREHGVPVIAGYRAVKKDGQDDFLPGANESLAGSFSDFGFNSVEVDTLFRIAHRVKLYEEVGGKLYLSSGLQVLKRYQGASAIQFHPDYIRVGVKNLKFSSRGRFVIDYRNTIPAIGFADAYNGNFARGTFADKVALIGATYQGTDAHNTPLGKKYGVEIQANILANLMLDNYVRVADREVIIIMVGLLALFLAFRKRVKGVFWLMLLSCLFAGSLIATVLFMRNCVLVQISPLLFFLLLVSVSLALFQKTIFVSRVYRTILFCDIEGSVKMFDEIGDRHAVRHIHTFYGLAKPMLRKWQCEFYRLLGDALMASFPSASNAVNASIDIQKVFRLHNQKKHQEKENRPLVVRASLNTGWCSILNASDLLGQVINIASRIEGMTEALQICVSEDTYREIKKGRRNNAFVFSPRGDMEFRGVSKKTPVYDVRWS